jgi:anti-anti-sigma factor
VLTLQGEHDLSTAARIRDELERVFNAGSAVVVDLSGVTFMDSSVLNAILYGSERAQQHEAHRFATVLPPPVRALLAGSSSSPASTACSPSTRTGSRRLRRSPATGRSDGPHVLA